jgi:hypothetical protein
MHDSTEFQNIPFLDMKKPFNLCIGFRIQAIAKLLSVKRTGSKMRVCASMVLESCVWPLECFRTIRIFTWEYLWFVPMLLPSVPLKIPSSVCTAVFPTTNFTNIPCIVALITTGRIFDLGQFFEWVLDVRGDLVLMSLLSMPG